MQDSPLKLSPIRQQQETQPLTQGTQDGESPIFETPHFNFNGVNFLGAGGGIGGNPIYVMGTNDAGNTTPARRLSEDSYSSYTSSEIVMVQYQNQAIGIGASAPSAAQKAKKSKMVIKKNHLMKAGAIQGTNTRVFTQTQNILNPSSNQQQNLTQSQQDAFERTYSHPNPGIFAQPPQGQIVGTQYASQTDHSDSEMSNFENQSIGSHKLHHNPTNGVGTGIGGSGVKLSPQLYTAAQTAIHYQIQPTPQSARGRAIFDPDNNSLNSSILSSIVGGISNQPVTPQGLEFQQQPQVYRVDTDHQPHSNIKYLNKVKPTKEEERQEHPFADKLSPYEEWKNTLLTVMETSIQFMLHDIFWNACYYTWNTILYVFFILPFAALGLVIEYLRQIKKQCMKCRNKEEPSPFSQFTHNSQGQEQKSSHFHKDTPSHSFEHDDNNGLQNSVSLITKSEKRRREAYQRNQFDNMSPPRYESKGDFIIVVDLDHTLVYSQQVSNPDTKLSTSLNESFLTIKSLGSLNGASLEEPLGGNYLVYKRPYLDKFLQVMSCMGEIHIFTASARSYADPVIDAIDPNGYITGRYYRDHCSMDKKGNVVKPIDIISKNWKKIIVIDDSEIVYNMYRENTILVEAWSPLKGRKQDRALQYCIDVLEQLRVVKDQTDVRKSLRSIIDTNQHYRR